MSKDILSVSDLVFHLKNLVESDFKYIRVAGEITQVSKAHSGHYYFNLSDDQSLISCALFRMDARMNPIIQSLKEGDLIEVEGSISLYQKRSSIQIIVKKISKKDEKGKLIERFNKIKLSLFKEGLLDEVHKREIPKNPSQIALITSPQGAAYGDFVKILDENSFSYNVTLFPAIVQGKNSESSLLEALNCVIKSEDNYDVIVFTRGGGSLEDLWSFNSESLARKVFECSIPVISAIGHEVNISILDLVSDMRCSTPSDAAKLLSVYQREQLIRFKHVVKKIHYFIESKLLEIKRLKQSYSPKAFYKSLEQQLNIKRLNLEQFSNRDYLQEFKVYNYEMELDSILSGLQVAMESNFKNLKFRLEKVLTQKAGLDPHQVLNRGYTYISANDKIIENKKAFNKNKSKDFQIYFKDGSVDVKGAIKK